MSERLAQTRGFDGFNYADMAAEVGITTASLHYHFPTKVDLGLALVERYTVAFAAALAAISAGTSRGPARLEGYARIYRTVLEAGRTCLCGMLAAEYQTLPESLQRAIRRFFDANEAWLTAVLARGRDDGDLAFAGSARDAARHWTSALEGALLLARPYGDASRLARVARRMIDAWALPRGAGSRSVGRVAGGRASRAARARRA